MNDITKILSVIMFLRGIEEDAFVSQQMRDSAKRNADILQGIIER